MSEKMDHLRDAERYFIKDCDKSKLTKEFNREFPQVFTLSTMGNVKKGYKVHHKKILNRYYLKQKKGLKPWEIRKNDCEYKEGDHIIFTVIDDHTKNPNGKKYT